MASVAILDFVFGHISVPNEICALNLVALKAFNYSCIGISLHWWQSALDRGDSVGALFVDFSKAFYRVNDNILLHKLCSQGIPEFLLKWSYSFLAERRQRVRIQGTRSGWLDLMGSMPQRSLLGLLLFLLLVDDFNTN